MKGGMTVKLSLLIPMYNEEKIIEATLREVTAYMADTFESNPAWSGLSAVKNGRYLLLPRDLFHYKPNARWGESYAYLANILYPD